MDIPKAQTDDDWLSDSGPFWRGALLDGGHTAMVSCANGHLAYLSDHTIAEDGTVSPSLVCPEQGCTWHVNAKLLGWTP